MNKVVRRETLASALPPELRGDIAPDQKVVVTVEEVGPERDRRERIFRHLGSARERGTTIEEAVERIRKLRDEWD